jgi:hypothetical protein
MTRTKAIMGKGAGLPGRHFSVSRVCVLLMPKLPGGGSAADGGPACLYNNSVAFCPFSVLRW